MTIKQWWWCGTLAALGLAGRAGAEPPDGHWRGVVGASLAATSGNSNTHALVLNLDVSRLTDEHKTSLTGYVNEGKSKAPNGQSTTTAGKWGLAGQYDRNINEDWFGFGKLSLERDRLIDLKLRTLGGAGVGYHVVRTEANTFDVFGGLSETIDRYRINKTVGDEQGRRFASSGVLLGQESSHQLTPTVFVKQRLEYYTGFSGPLAQLVKYNASLNVAMTKTMSLSLSLIDTYNSRPANGQKRNDASLLTGVNLKLGD